VSFSGNSNALVNLGSGIINGGVSMTGSNNSVTLFTGSVISGALNMGADTQSLLTLDGAETSLFSSAITGATTFAGGLTKQGAGIWTIDRTLNVSFVTISEGALQLGNGGTNGSFGSGNITNNAALIVKRSDATTLSNTISGTGSFTQSGTGTTTLSASNSYSGGTAINAGKLAISNGSSFGDNTVTFASNGTTVAALASVRVTNKYVLTGDGTMDVGAFILTNSGVISGAGSLTKAGAGTMVLGAANTYTGGTTINVGTVAISNGAAFGSNTVNFASNGTTVAALASVRVANNYALTGNGTMDVGANNLTNFGVISGAGGLTKAGTGTMVLSGNNSYTGATTVSAGTLELASLTGSAAGSVSSVTVATGATLLVSQSNQVNNNATVTLSGGTITRGSGVSEVFGNLNLTEASFLDFGAGTAGNLTFGTYQNNTTPSALLTLNNFTFGNSFTFNSTSFSQGSINSYFQFGTGFVDYSLSNTGSTFTITAIPEPSTYVAAIGLLALMLWPLRRRLRGKVS
jgi:fibronectin-binding autotransporter adhesin